MRNNQKGFGVVEILLILVFVGLVGGIGWYYTQHTDKNQPSATEQTVKTKLYTNSSKLYSLSYPDTWTAKEAADCCEGAPQDYTKVSRGVTFVPAGKADIHGYGLQVLADKTDSLAKSIEQNWTDNQHTPESKIINGYDAKHVKVNFNGDAENYIDHHYLVTHNGASVFMTFREKYYHQYPAEEWSAAQDIDAFHNTLHSIKFLN